MLKAQGEDFDQDKLFYDIVGGHDKKRRLYGFGSFAQVIPSMKEAALGSRPGTNKQVEDLMELVKKQNEQLEEMKAVMEANEERHQAAITKLQKNYEVSMDLVRAYQRLSSQEEDSQFDDSI